MKRVADELTLIFDASTHLGVSELVSIVFLASDYDPELNPFEHPF